MKTKVGLHFRTSLPSYVEFGRRNWVSLSRSRATKETNGADGIEQTVQLLEKQRYTLVWFRLSS